MTEKKNKYQEDLSVIRSMMERSSKFISLSGLSGITAGLIALTGGIWALYLVQGEGRNYLAGSAIPYSTSLLKQLFLIALLILALALASAVFFTVRKTRKSGLKVWTTATKQLLGHLFVPLLIGGTCCLGLIYHGVYWLVAPATLIFYGLALINASKYTYQDVYYLGLMQAGLGIIGCFVIGYGLICWIVGFGILHIAYGILMQRKYH